MTTCSRMFSLRSHHWRQRAARSSLKSIIGAWASEEDGSLSSSGTPRAGTPRVLHRKKHGGRVLWMARGVPNVIIIFGRPTFYDNQRVRTNFCLRLLQNHKHGFNEVYKKGYMKSIHLISIPYGTSLILREIQKQCMPSAGDCYGNVWKSSTQDLNQIRWKEFSSIWKEEQLTFQRTYHWMEYRKNFGYFCLGFNIPLENISLIWRHYHCR